MASSLSDGVSVDFECLFGTGKPILGRRRRKFFHSVRNHARKKKPRPKRSRFTVLPENGELFAVVVRVAAKQIMNRILVRVPKKIDDQIR